jgi:hypothetical protein
MDQGRPKRRADTPGNHTTTTLGGIPQYGLSEALRPPIGAASFQQQISASYGLGFCARRVFDRVCVDARRREDPAHFVERLLSAQNC